VLVGRYDFLALFQDEALLPEYKGSTFRGVFGRALKSIVCALRLQECGDCLLRCRCLYPAVFERPPDTPSSDIKTGSSDPPRPYVIEPPPESRARYLPGEPFAFTLVLFGPYNDSLPYFIYAIEQMGLIGIGRRVNGHGARYRLERVTSTGRPVYEAEGRVLHRGPYARSVDAACLAAPAAGEKVEYVGLRLLTPLRLKYRNRLVPELPFHLVVRAALRRVSTLFSLYGEGEPDLDYRGLVHRAAAVEIASQNISWHDWRRYSNRQEREMLMGGIVGEVVYKGELDEFMPLLSLSETLHLGKATTFGLGRVELFQPGRDGP